MTDNASGYIAALRAKCDDRTAFWAIDATGLFEWQTSDSQQKESREGGNAFAFRYSKVGTLAFAIEYLRFMIGREFNVAYLIDTDSDPRIVLLKAWMPGTQEPSWSDISNPGLKETTIRISENTVEEQYSAKKGSIAITYDNIRKLIVSSDWTEWKTKIFHKGMNLQLKNLNHPLHSFRGRDFDDLDLSCGYFEMSDFSEATFCNARLTEVNFRGAIMFGADLSKADLSNANLHRANLRRADLSGANLQGADLSRADLEDANLTSADLTGAKLGGAVLIRTDLSSAILTGCNVHGISVWNATLHNTLQDNLVITDGFEAEVTVDNLAMAQFVYVLLNNGNVRSVIETVSSKLVLILGRFTPERKGVLDAIRVHLRLHNYLPVLFDFEKPASRDLTETVSALAHLARFIIADITDAKSIPQELMAIVPQLPSVPVQPLLLASHLEYAMFEHFKRYPWVLPAFIYDSAEHLLSSIDQRVIAAAEAKAREHSIP